ncbi:WD-40 repeat-containing protein, partial [Reticulomyxa filosa]
MEKLKNDIKGKDDEIKKIKEKIPKKNDDNKEEQKENNNTFMLNLESICNFKLLKTLNEHANAVYSIDYSIIDNCQFICSGSRDKTVRVWDINNNDKYIKSFNEHSAEVCFVKFSPYHYYNYKQNVICSSSIDRTIRFWDIKNNKQLQIFSGSTCGIEFSSFNNGRYLCSGSEKKVIRLWDIETPKLLHVFNGHENA